MKYIYIILLIWGGRVTAMPDTSVVHQQQGVLFLSSYNGDYDYSGEEIRSVGFF